MTQEEFKKKYNVRRCEKCCGNCVHSVDKMDDGLQDCVHPLLKGTDLVVLESDVCDLWKGYMRCTR